MNKHTWLVLLCCATVGIGRAGAQEDNTPPPPSPPFVQELPRDAAWKFTVVQKNKPASSPSPSPNSGAAAANGAAREVVLLKEAKVTRVGNDMRIVKTWSDGRSTEEWRYEGYLLMTQPYNSAVYVVGLSQDAAARLPALSGPAFPELSWLTAANYVKVESIKGKLAYLFQDATVAMPALAPAVDPTAAMAKAHPARRAWIDQATKLPVAFENGNEVWTYGYTDPPTSPLVLPAAFAKTLEEVKRDTAGMHHERLKL